ncbi:MAG: hypothetical protein FWD26_04285 [Treponema sp.]|nr:hypothetical protein [Treponema sp.]
MTDFLYARPSVIEGIGRNIDLFGILNSYNVSKDGTVADQKARKNDIEALKKDFEKSYGLVINGHKN